ncbi:MAG: alpha/beta fold hydrolase [Myxococcota bacterium]|nr:alpha/beta fold hydrolase [Myxococcota bacterium]
MGWLRGLGITLILGVSLLAGLMAFAARSIPARDAVGVSRAVASGDASIQYFVGGAQGAAAPVVLVASYARSAADFNELVEALNAAGHPTYAVETRGVRDSTLPSVNVTLHTFASDIAAVLQAEKVDRPIVMLGHAYGNRIARAYSSDFPDKVAQLVLLCAGGEEPTPEEVTGSIGKAQFPIFSDETRRAAIHHAFFAEASEVDEDWMKGWYPIAGIAQVQAMQATPNAEWADGGRAPILVLQPAEDAAAPGGGLALKSRLPDRVALVEIANAGHALLPEQPERVRDTILAHIGAL